MLKIFIYFYVMMFMFLIFLWLCLILHMKDSGVVLEWMMFSFNSMNVEIMILVDWISLLFVSLIFLISSMIMIYSSVYMSGEKFIDRFIYLMILFIFSMILMIISPNIISILFGWDGLGLVSYCLVVFYQNYMSYNSGMVTVLCNRIGDIGLLMGIGLLMVYGSWNMNMFWSDNVIILLLLAAVTKSAQIPFSMWLPMAMAAPTPVSALVHSSTLVTAGVYLMIRFNNFLMSSGLSLLLMYLSILTMFMSSFMANVENDLKKIIALSTLSQLSIMMMILSLGLSMVSYYHLLVHAVFKSMLFMCAGVIIHLMMNNQDIRLLGNLNEIIPFTMMSFMVSILALSGFPFVSGYYSKDLIMELVYISKVNSFMMVLILISLMFTVTYSFRLFYYMFFCDMKMSSFCWLKEDKMMNFSMIILIFLSLISGSSLNWIFFFDYYLVYMKLSMKLVTMMVCLVGYLVGMILMFYNIKSYNLNYYLNNMWFMSYLYFKINSFVMNFMGLSFYKADKVWMEFMIGDIIMYFLKNISNSLFKVSMFMMILVSVFMIIMMVY